MAPALELVRRPTRAILTRPSSIEAGRNRFDSLTHDGAARWFFAERFGRSQVVIGKDHP